MSTVESAEAAPFVPARRAGAGRALLCRSCGYASAEAAFFRTEAVHGRSCALCAGCGAVDRRFHPPIRALASLVLVPLGAFLQARDPDGFGLIRLMLGGAYLSAAFAAPVHELGHALATIAMGGRLETVRIGAGDRVHAVSIAGVWFEFGDIFPLGGHCCQTWDGPAHYRARTIVVLLAGPLANLAAALAIAGLVRLTGLTLAANPGLLSLAVGAALLQLYIVVRNLWPWPRPARSDGSDGQQIRWLLTAALPPADLRSDLAILRAAALVRRNRVADAERLCLEAWRLDPSSGGLLGYLLHCKLWLDGPEAATRWYLEEAAAAAQTSATHHAGWAAAWANVAYNALLSDLPAAEALAAEAVAKARAVDSGMAAVDGVDGMLKLRRGEPLDALRLLRQAAQSSDTSDKAAFCPSLAEAEDALGRPEMALQYTLLGRHLRAGEPPVQRRRAP